MLFEMAIVIGGVLGMFCAVTVSDGWRQHGSVKKLAIIAAGGGVGGGIGAFCAYVSSFFMVHL